jgi:hypothetical protein
MEPERCFGKLEEAFRVLQRRLGDLEPLEPDAAGDEAVPGDEPIFQAQILQG